MPTIEEVSAFLADENGLVVISTTQADGRVLSSVVNCGVMDHPLTGSPCVALVSAGRARRDFAALSGRAAQLQLRGRTEQGEQRARNGPKAR